MAGQRSALVCTSIVWAIFKRDLQAITIFQISKSTFSFNFWAIIPKLSGYIIGIKIKKIIEPNFVLGLQTYPESLGIIAQKLKEKIDSEVWKMVICDKLRLKIACTIEIHTGTDHWPAITLAAINIFWWGKKQLVDLVLLFHLFIIIQSKQIHNWHMTYVNLLLVRK